MAASGGTDSSGPARGLAGLSQGLLDAAMSMAAHRAELFGVEAQEEKLRVTRLLIAAAAAAALVVMALTTLAIACGMLALGVSGSALLGGVGVFHALLAWLLYRWISRQIVSGPKPFEQSMAELRKDQACLTTLA